MNWNKDKSVVLSQVCVFAFAICLLALDISAVPLANHLLGDMRGTAVLVGAVYAGSAFGWICLWNLHRLLTFIRRNAVFVSENVRAMRRVSWCCFGAAAVSFFCAVYPLPGIPFAVLGVAEAFMGLIVRIVKNAFEQAIAMKDELDLTV